MTTGKSFIFCFDDVEVREREFSLVKAGEVLPIEPKAFRVLVFLLHNPQKLITKEELLDAVWADAAVTESSLTRSIAKLRRVLGDDFQQPRYIETVATVGYRWVCKVEASEDRSGSRGRIGGGVATGDVPVERASTNRVTEPSAEPSSKGQGRRTTLTKWLLTGGSVLAAGAAIAIWYLHRPLPPRFSGYTQITHDGLGKVVLGTDGSRVYFNRLSPPSIAQVSVAGGPAVEVPVAVPNPDLLDVSPDGSSFLVASHAEDDNGALPLWIVRVLGGSIRRLGDGVSAAFSPDGKSVAYSTLQGDIYLVRSDGSDAHKLASPGGYIPLLAWRPDGGAIRFTRDAVLWEISSNGTNPHQLLPGWHGSGKECCGHWTPDGRFFLFLAINSFRTGGQIWALDERRRLFRQPTAEPVQLTMGPILWHQPIFGKDRKTVFTEGDTERGELSRFDPQTRQFKPFLGGISVDDLVFSTDGQSVAYVSYPEGFLWRAKRDGTSPVQLTEPPMEVFYPRWSPDGTQIAFTGGSRELPLEIYTVPADGGNPHRLLPEDKRVEGDPSWSPDGRKIAFVSAITVSDKAGDIRVLDLASHQVTTLPGTVGMGSPLWSPDGRFIVAATSSGLSILDIGSGRWSVLLDKVSTEDMELSRDGQFLYFLRTDTDQGVFRVRLSGGKPVLVADLKNWHAAGFFDVWMGLDPTDAPLMLRDIGSNDIYALTLDEK
jgi:Tol biopolymer transport system component/DNA-binding winged helix-turn-helix (wHTH) protein